MVDVSYSPEPSSPGLIEDIIPEDNVERLRNIRDMFENSNYSEELILQKVEKLQPSEKLIDRLTKFEEGAVETNEEEEEENDESEQADGGIVKNRRVQKKKDVIPFAELNNVKTKFEKYGEQNNEVPQTPKPMRSITPPREGANTGEIENQPMQRPDDVVSVYAKVEDKLPDAGYARSRKELFDSIADADAKRAADGELPRVKSITPPREDALKRVLKETTPERNENVIRESDRSDDILPTVGHIKNTAAIFANGRQKSIERSGITLEGELLEKGIAKQRLALFSDPSALNTASHAPSTAELESEYIKNVSGIAKERLNLFKTLEQTGGETRTSPSRELKKLKEFTPPPQLDHQQRQYIIIDKPSNSSSSASSPTANMNNIGGGANRSTSTSSASSSSSASPPSSVIEPAGEFVPEHGLAKSRMRQYLEITGHANGNTPIHDQVVDELATKGLAKSLLAKWKSMESVKAESVSSMILTPHHHHHAAHYNHIHSDRPAHPVAMNLSSRSSANATSQHHHVVNNTPVRRNLTPHNPMNQSRAISKDRGCVVVVAPFVEVSSNAEAEQMPQAGIAKQLLSKWQHNLESSTSTILNHSTGVVRQRAMPPPRPITPPNELERVHLHHYIKNEDDQTDKSKDVFQDEALAAIGKGHAKSALARFESQPLESNVNAQFIEEDIIPSAGNAKSLKDKFLNLEKEATKIETSSAKMTYVPKKFTAPSSSNSSSQPKQQQQQQQQQQPQQQPQQAKAKANPNGLLTTAPSAQAGQNGAGEKCCVCEKTVYAMEKIEADKKVYHKTCFKCTSCNCPLKLGNFSSIKQTLYCTPHYIQLFARNGNYDEGFGLENYKRKWLNSQQQQQPNNQPNSRTTTTTTVE